MLRQLRSAEKIKKIIWVGLLLIIIPSFVAFYGYSDWSRTSGNQPMTAAKIKFGLFDSAEVQQADMMRAEQMLRGQYTNYARAQSMAVDPATIDKLMGPRDILDQAINLEILRQFAEDHGIVVSTQDAMAELHRQIPAQYRQQVEMQWRQQGMSVATVVERTRESMLMQRVRDTLAAQTRVTHYEAWLDYQLKNERLLVDFVRFDAADFSTSVTVDDKELDAYFKENIKKFHVPEQVKYSYLLVRKDDLKSSVTVSNDEITSYYQEQQEEFRLPRTAELREIMIKRPTPAEGSMTAEALTSATEAARAKATDIYQRIAKGEDFATLADQYNEETRFPPREEMSTAEGTTATAADKTTTAGGYLGWVSEARTKVFYGEEWTSAAFSLKTGAVSQPVESPRGFFIIRQEALKEGLVQPLETVRAQVEDKIRTQKAEPLFEEIGNQLREAAAKEATLSQLAKETSQTLQQTEKVDKRAEFLPGIGLLGEFKEAVLDLAKGGRSDVMSDTARHLAMEVVEEFPDHDPTLDEARERVVQAFKDMKAREMAKKAAEALKAKSTDLETMQKAVADAGSTVTRTRPFTRTEAPTVLGPVQNFVQSSAGMRKGSINLAPLGAAETPQGYLVWHTAEVTEPSRADFAKQLGKITQELLGQKREVLLLEWLRDQRKQLSDKIEISEAYR